MNINSSVIWCDSESFHSEAQQQIESASSVLDIGCGIRPQQYVIPEYLICVEPHLEYVEILKKNLQGSNALIIPLDAISALRALPDSSVDSIFLIDVIEHMEKETGMDVIVECERVARQQIILFTPLGFMPQEIHAGEVDGWNLNGGLLQDHKSGWYPEDFIGWNVIACKALHTIDFKGEPINPAYGGFYAIKSISKAQNCFNDIYSKEILASTTNNLDFLRSLFPQFIDQIVYREIEKSNLKCGIQSCQRTTELLIELGAEKPVSQIEQMVKLDRDAAYLTEARVYNSKLMQFASQFVNVNERESQLANHETNLRALETDLNRREVIIANSFYSKMSRKIKPLK